MKTVTQIMLYRQALIKYSLKYGVTKVAIRYKTNRQYIYRWRKRYDGTIESLADKSHHLIITRSSISQMNKTKATAK